MFRRNPGDDPELDDQVPPLELRQAVAPERHRDFRAESLDVPPDLDRERILGQELRESERAKPLLVDVALIAWWTSVRLLVGLPAFPATDTLGGEERRRVDLQVVERVDKGRPTFGSSPSRMSPTTGPRCASGRRATRSEENWTASPFRE